MLALIHKSLDGYNHTCTPLCHNQKVAVLSHWYLYKEIAVIKHPFKRKSTYRKHQCTGGGKQIWRMLTSYIYLLYLPLASLISFFLTLNLGLKPWSSPNKYSNKEINNQKKKKTWFSPWWGQVPYKRSASNFYRIKKCFFFVERIVYIWKFCVVKLFFCFLLTLETQTHAISLTHPCPN